MLITLVGAVGGILSIIYGKGLSRFICEGPSELFQGIVFGIITGSVLSWILKKNLAHITNETDTNRA
jgi:membrane associated rhomboid family serine protease